MSVQAANHVRLAIPSVVSLLPEGHYSYTNEAKTTYVKRHAIKLPANVARRLRGLGTGMKVAIGAVFFLFCLFLPAASATVAFSMASESAPVSTIRTQEVPASAVASPLEQSPRNGVIIDISWVND